MQESNIHILIDGAKIDTINSRGFAAHQGNCIKFF